MQIGHRASGSANPNPHPAYLMWAFSCLLYQYAHIIGAVLKGDQRCPRLQKVLDRWEMALQKRKELPGGKDTHFTLCFHDHAIFLPFCDGNTFSPGSRNGFHIETARRLEKRYALLFVHLRV
jgi:hypothetical protein